MLVPSTLTGWYRKMMMNADTTTDTTRARNQECITPQLCLGGSVPGMFSGSWSNFPSVSTLSPNPPYLDAAITWKQPSAGQLPKVQGPPTPANHFISVAIVYITGL